MQILDSSIHWLVNIGMAVGPIIGYVSQYRLIKNMKQVGSFSIDICGILLFANILRLNFYIFKQYQLTLVFQSLFMIAMQILLLFQCCKHSASDQQPDTGNAEQKQPALPKQYCKQFREQFWRWKSFDKFGVTILFFVFCTFFISFIFKITAAAQFYGQLIGLVALTSQSVLIAPQIIRNIQKQSTKGLSHLLVFFNLFGDLFKLGYFIINQQPFQFILCGIVQVILDSFVIVQIFYYTYYQNLQQKVNNRQKNSQNKQQKINQMLQSQNNFGKLNTNSDRQQNDNQLQNNNKIRKQISIEDKKNSKLDLEINKNLQNKQEFPNYQYLNQQIQIQQYQKYQRSNLKQSSSSLTKYENQSSKSTGKDNIQEKKINNNMELFTIDIYQNQQTK